MISWIQRPTPRPPLWHTSPLDQLNGRKWRRQTASTGARSLSFRSNTFPPPCPHEADGLEEFRAPGQNPTALPLPETCFAIQYVYGLFRNIWQLLTGLLLANLEKFGWGVCGVGNPFSMRIETIRKGDKLRTYIVSDLLLVNKRVLSENRISRQV